MKKIILILSFISIAFVAVAQKAGITAEVKEHINARIEVEKNVGIVVGYIDGDTVEYYNYGKTALTGGTEVNEQSVFEIGSISKVFTTILLAEQVASGNMNLSDPIAKYLPKTVTVPTRNGKEITLKDLATHSSGLPRLPTNINPADPSNPFADYNTQLTYDFLSGHELTRDIGEAYEYSNYAMGLLGHILELHTGKTYEQLVAEKITDPNQMKSTRVVLNTNMRNRLAKGHAFKQEVPNWDFQTMAGAGGIKSTIVDMVKFLKANMSTNTATLGKAIALSHKVAYTNQEFEIGLGWHYDQDEKENKIIWHNGRTAGYSAFAGFIEDTTTGVIVLSNSNETIDDLGLKILDDSRELTLPVKKEELPIIEVSETILETYVGRYELAPTFSITVTREGSQLFLQATDQPRFEIYPSAPTEFFLKVVEASISFSVNDSNEVESLTLHQAGQHVPGKKVK